MHSYTLPYKLDVQWGRVRITGLSATIASETDSVAALEDDIKTAVERQRKGLIAGEPAISDANVRGQRTVTYQPDLPTPHGQITRVAFSVEGERLKPSLVQEAVEDWFPTAELPSMTKSATSSSSTRGCGLPFLALLCFVLLVGILLASISGDRFGESTAQTAGANQVTLVPDNAPNANNNAAINNAAVQPAQVSLPVLDCSQIADESQRQQCEQSTSLCPEGCSEYPLACELLVLKGDIDQQNGQKLYYTQQSPQYNQIEIEPATGERWFCTPQAAERAGWTKAP